MNQVLQDPLDLPVRCGNFARGCKKNAARRLLLPFRLRFLATLALSLPALVACERAIPKYEFHLTRIDATGKEHGEGANFAEHPWACVRDEKTGLTWEVKTAAPGLHSRENTYTWYSTDETANMGYEGKREGGTCTASACNTEAFVAALNAEKLCGYADWRMPTTDEASSLVDASVRYPGPTIPEEFFPNTQNSKIGYWTATAFDKHADGAWAWRLDHGADFVALKDQPRYARAVRKNR